MAVAARMEDLWAHALTAFLLLLYVDSLSGEEQVASRQQYPSPNKTYPDFNLYRRSNQLLYDISALVYRHPMIMSEKVWRSVATGYSTEMTIVTVEPGGRNSNIEKLRVLLNFGQHGRELVTSEIAFLLLRTLSGENILKNYDIDLSNRVLENIILKIVPMENMNGRKKVEEGETCERKNGRGVDTNRNWDVDWGKKEQDYDPYEEYPGTAPFSEPETRILLEVATLFKPHVWVNVHSGMQALLMPYDHRNTTPEQCSTKPMQSLLQTINARHCKSNCTIGSGGSSVGYLAHGTATDYMYLFLKVPVAFTFEIYGDANADENDCFLMFNPTTPAAFERTVINWCNAFFTLFIELPSALASIFDTDGRSCLTPDLLLSNPLLHAARRHLSQGRTNYFGRKARNFWSSNEETNAIFVHVTEEYQILAELLCLFLVSCSLIFCFTLFKRMRFPQSFGRKSIDEIA